MGEVRKFSLGDKPAYYFAARWSPDSKKISYLDCHSHIWYIDLEQKKPVLVDTDYYPSDQDLRAEWSPESN